MNSADELIGALVRLKEGSHSEADVRLVSFALEARTINVTNAVASGPGAVAIAGNADGAFIVTVTGGGSFIYHGDSAVVLGAIFEKYLNPDPPLFAPKAAGRTAGRLHYSEPSPFVGREFQKGRLSDFLLSSSPFSWWLMAGPAGVGKSRLALEMASTLKSEWTFGFLRPDEGNFQWANWQPKKNSLVVVDYVAVRALRIGNILELLEQRRESLGHAVRFLLLERRWSESDDWWQEFIGTGGHEQAVRAGQYEASPLTLEALSGDQLWTILSNELQRRNQPLPSRIMAEEVLAKVDSHGRPLFALLLANALTEQTNVLRLNLDAEQLVRIQLKRDRNKFWLGGVEERHENLVAYATIVGGLKLEQIPQIPLFKKYFPKPEDFRVERIESVTGEIATEQVASLKPNLVGELFVLDHLEPNHALDTSRVSTFAATAWSLHGPATYMFFRRAVDDFPDHPTLKYFLKGRSEKRGSRSKDEEEWEWVSRDAALAHAVALYVDRHRVKDAAEMYKELAASQSSHPPLPRGTSLRAEAAANLSIAYSSAKQRQQAEMMYGEVLRLIKDIPSDDPFFYDHRTASGAELVELYCEQGDLKAADALYWELQDGSPAYSRFSSAPARLASAAVFLVAGHLAKDDLEAAIRVAHVLRVIPEANQTRDFARPCALVFAQLITRWLSLGDIGTAVAWYQEQLRKFTIKFPTAEEICCTRATSASQIAWWLSGNAASLFTKDDFAPFFSELEDLFEKACQSLAGQLSPIQTRMWRKAVGFLSIALIYYWVNNSEQTKALKKWQSLREALKEELKHNDGPFGQAFSASLSLVDFLSKSNNTQAIEVYATTLKEIKSSTQLPLELLQTTMSLCWSLRDSGNVASAQHVESLYLSFLESSGGLASLASKMSKTREEMIAHVRKMLDLGRWTANEP